jgi:hypothetical protein
MAESSLRVCAELFGFRAMSRISTYVEFVVKRWQPRGPRSDVQLALVIRPVLELAKYPHRTNYPDANSRLVLSLVATVGFRFAVIRPLTTELHCGPTT